MVSSLGARFFAGCTATAIVTPLYAGFGALGGYIYGKLADLPAGQIAKAWAIWSVVQGALLAFVVTLISDRDTTTKVFAHIIITNVSTIVGIHELRKRGLMGDKMMIFLIAMQILNNIATPLAAL